MVVQRPSKLPPRDRMTAKKYFRCRVAVVNMVDKGCYIEDGGPTKFDIPDLKLSEVIVNSSDV